MTLAIQDLKLRVHDLDFSAEDIDQTFGKLDLDQTGLINLSQFVVATLDRTIFSEETYSIFFKDLDSLQEGFLTKETIKIALDRKLIEISMESIEGFLLEAGISSEDQKIDYEMFKQKILDI